MLSEGKSIKQLHEDDRPREKMLLKGTTALSNAELLSILLGSGTKQLNAVQLAQKILDSANQSINQLARYDMNQLQQFSGVGPAKAVRVLAALEFMRRKKSEVFKESIIEDSQSVYHIMEPHLSDLPNEEFWVLFLNQKNRLITKKCFSHGGITGTVVDKRLIIKEALLINSVGIVLAHNHPSGNTNPSQADIQLTHQIQEAAELMGIRVLDHIIIAEQNYTSLADSGLITNRSK